MQTQLRVTVKNGSIITRASSYLLWFIKMFKKSEIQVWVDDRNCEPVVLKARKEPYEIPITPGQHVVYFDDPKRNFRVKMWNLTIKLYNGMFGFLIGTIASDFGDISGGIVLAEAYAGGGRTEIRDNVLACNLVEGDEVSVTVKPKMKKVKIKVNG